MEAELVLVGLCSMFVDFCRAPWCSCISGLSVSLGNRSSNESLSVELSIESSEAPNKAKETINK